MGFPLPRVHTWVSLETLTAADLNAEFDNILQNNSPQNINDYSATIGQMQIQTSPGSVGSESLATSLSGEIERLRYIIALITGNTYWYSSPIKSISDLASFTQIPSNRIISGATRGSLGGGITSNQPSFLRANGATGVKLLATSTNFIAFIGDTKYTASADITSGALSAAPGSNNTALINMNYLGGGDATLGETFGVGNLGTIEIDTVGSNISGAVGKYAGFKVTHTAVDEYFIAKIESAGSLSNIKRGFFFDTSGSPVRAVASADNDVITLLKLTWVFLLNSAGNFSLSVTYNEPNIRGTQPVSPSVGDFWYDTVNNTWKQYNGSVFASVTAVFVGLCMQDSSGSTVAARSADFFKQFNELNTISDLSYDYTGQTQLFTKGNSPSISVYGTTYRLNPADLIWDGTNDKSPEDTFSGTPTVYIYVTDSGIPIFSTVFPNDRVQDLQGHYHPYNPWRCVGSVGYTAATAKFSTVVKVFDSKKIVPFSITYNVTAGYSNGTTGFTDMSDVARLRVVPGQYWIQVYGGRIDITGSATGEREVSIQPAATLITDNSTNASASLAIGAATFIRTSVGTAGFKNSYPGNVIGFPIFIYQSGYLAVKLQGKCVTANTTLGVDGTNNPGFYVQKVGEIV